jgi:transcriptional regulator with XRE-family HTH domain
MVKLDALKTRIRTSGLKMQYVAEKLGISRASLWKKMSGRVEFKVSEIAEISKVLNLTSDERDYIFFS